MIDCTKCQNFNITADWCDPKCIIVNHEEDVKLGLNKKLRNCKDYKNVKKKENS